MDLLIKLLKRELFKLLIIVAFIPGVVLANHAKQPHILATNYAVVDIGTGELLEEKNSNEVRSIASITKVMTAIVSADSGQDLSETILVKHIKGISTKLKAGLWIPRSTLIHLALLSSDNLAAKLLATNYPGGEHAFVIAMNYKAREIGMLNSEFTDPTGLLDTNVSTVNDLIKLVIHADNYQNLKDFSVTKTQVAVPSKKKLNFINFNSTNKLVDRYKDIVFSKTGWIRKSGGCLIMLVHNQSSKRIIVLLNSKNTHTRIVDGDLLHGIYNNG
jgi:D-alanyl-D-alanine endopeptidase (penicillin-binding protein 7)